VAALPVVGPLESLFPGSGLLQGSAHVPQKSATWPCRSRVKQTIFVVDRDSRPVARSAPPARQSPSPRGRACVPHPSEMALTLVSGQKKLPREPNNRVLECKQIAPRRPQQNGESPARPRTVFSLSFSPAHTLTQAEQTGLVDAGSCVNIFAQQQSLNWMMAASLMPKSSTSRPQA